MDCYACTENASTDRPPRQEVVLTERWRVTHAITCSLPGWLVLVPRRHVTSLAELDDDELAEMGLLQGRVSRALQATLGCEKTYAVMFAERAGFAHLHVHLVPRMPDQPVDRTGPGVFGYLADGEESWVSAEEMDRLARTVGALC